MVLEHKNYVPTLAVRASEMNGLEFLPAATKDRMTPCFLLAPWANSGSLDKTIARIEKSYASRPYFLDIDRDYEIQNLESEAQQQLAHLLDPSNCYQNWCDFVAHYPSVWPCIQTKFQTESDLIKQIERVQSFARPYALRLMLTQLPENMTDIVSAFSRAGTADFAIILEGGWTRDPLTLFAWFNGLIAGSLSEIDAAVPIVVSCTSIPSMFTTFNSSVPTEVPFSNHMLVDQIVRNTNKTRIIYGDWGSTRPRDKGGFANRPLDRVDYPTNSSWFISRSKDLDWTFKEAAEAIVSCPHWDGNLGIWGEEIIQITAVNKDLGINTPQKNVAARVNIHLHRQAFYGSGPIDPSTFDEDWQD